MKRQRRKVKSTNKPKPEAAVGAASSDQSTNRRDLLKTIRNGAVAVAVVGGGGWYLVESVRAGVREHDLSRIGNGTPTIVQIHDPQCSVCQALQREARDALGAFEEGELQFLIADIRRSEGQRFANRHGVSHVTLLLFDAEGQRQEVLVGSNKSEFLQESFRLLIDNKRSR